MIESPYFEGFRAGESGLTIDDNPYMPNTPFYHRWRDGWRDQQDAKR